MTNDVRSDLSQHPSIIEKGRHGLSDRMEDVGRPELLLRLQPAEPLPDRAGRQGYQDLRPPSGGFFVLRLGLEPVEPEFELSDIGVHERGTQDAEDLAVDAEPRPGFESTQKMRLGLGQQHRIQVVDQDEPRGRARPVRRRQVRRHDDAVAGDPHPLDPHLKVFVDTALVGLEKGAVAVDRGAGGGLRAGPGDQAVLQGGRCRDQALLVFGRIGLGRGRQQSDEGDNQAGDDRLHGRWILIRRHSILRAGRC